MKYAGKKASKRLTDISQWPSVIGTGAVHHHRRRIAPGPRYRLSAGGPSQGLRFPGAGRAPIGRISVDLHLGGQRLVQVRRSGRVAISAGMVILLFPRVWHSYGPARATGWNEHWVGFNGYLARRLVRHGFFTPDGRCCRRETKISC